MTKIVDIKAREVLDSRGNPTVAADVILEGGVVGSACSPFVNVVRGGWVAGVNGLRVVRWPVLGSLGALRSCGYLVGF